MGLQDSLPFARSWVVATWTRRRVLEPIEPRPAGLARRIRALGHPMDRQRQLVLDLEPDRGPDALVGNDLVAGRELGDRLRRSRSMATSDSAPRSSGTTSTGNPYFGSTPTRARRSSVRTEARVSRTRLRWFAKPRWSAAFLVLGLVQLHKSLRTRDRRPPFDPTLVFGSPSKPSSHDHPSDVDVRVIRSCGHHSRNRGADLLRLRPQPLDELVRRRCLPWKEELLDRLVRAVDR